MLLVCKDFAGKIAPTERAKKAAALIALVAGLSPQLAVSQVSAVVAGITEHDLKFLYLCTEIPTSKSSPSVQARTPSCFKPARAILILLCTWSLPCS